MAESGKKKKKCHLKPCQQNEGILTKITSFSMPWDSKLQF